MPVHTCVASYIGVSLFDPLLKVQAATNCKKQKYLGLPARNLFQSVTIKAFDPLVLWLWYL